MAEGEVYSVPYMMDIMVFWVNEKFLDRAGLSSVNDREDFEKLLDGRYGYGNYGYGSAWETSYVYNELSQFINMFGGTYGDWSDDNTREALEFLHYMAAEDKTPREQMVDQYEQMEQKFIQGKYGAVFMYSGAMDTFLRAGVYGKDKIDPCCSYACVQKECCKCGYMAVCSQQSLRSQGGGKEVPVLCGGAPGEHCLCRPHEEAARPS